MEKAVYETELLNNNLYKIFTGVYNDFKAVAIKEYMFEIPPLGYEDFIESLEKGLIDCIVLLENKIPTAFLVYTNAISEGIELNLIHCLGKEDIKTKRKLLIEKFLEVTKEARKEKVVCYPMLGTQTSFTAEIAHYGFKFVGLAVLRFMTDSSDSKNILNSIDSKKIDSKYEIVEWDNKYFEAAVKIIHKGFKESSDALFDPRYKTSEGVRDILDKVVQGVYGEFLPKATSVLLNEGIACGFCFINITAGTIANIPLVSIERSQQGKGLSKYLVKRSTEAVLELNRSGERGFSELNVSAETSNISALKMYRHVGFKEDYSYPQSYIPITKNKII